MPAKINYWRVFKNYKVKLMLIRKGKYYEIDHQFLWMYRDKMLDQVQMFSHRITKKVIIL